MKQQLNILLAHFVFDVVENFKYDEEGRNRSKMV